MSDDGKQRDGMGTEGDAAWAEWGPRLTLLWRRRKLWLRYFVRVTGSWADAEGLLSSLLLRVMQENEGPDEGEALDQWLRDAARAVAWNWQRARRRRDEQIGRAHV